MMDLKYTFFYGRAAVNVNVCLIDITNLHQNTFRDINALPSLVIFRARCVPILQKIYSLIANQVRRHLTLM